MNFWFAMRQAAMMRHAMLVCSLYPPGPARDAALHRHMAMVDALYWPWGWR